MALSLAQHDIAMNLISAAADSLKQEGLLDLLLSPCTMQSPPRGPKAQASEQSAEVLRVLLRARDEEVR